MYFYLTHFAQSLLCSWVSTHSRPAGYLWHKQNHKLAGKYTPLSEMLLFLLDFAQFCPLGRNVFPHWRRSPTCALRLLVSEIQQATTGITTYPRTGAGLRPMPCNYLLSEIQPAISRRATQVGVCELSGYVAGALCKTCQVLLNQPNLRN